MEDRLRPQRLAALIAAAALTLAACAASGTVISAGTGTSPAVSTAASSASVTSAQQSLVEIPAGTVADTTVPALPTCTKAAVPTASAGVLTIATGSHGESPWFLGNDPASGRGLEAAVAYAIADGLGFPSDHVRWTRVDRREASAGRTTDFDLDLDQFTAPDPGTTTADYSTGYYAINDSILVPAGTSKPSSVAEIEQLGLGATPGAGASSSVSDGPRRMFVSDEAAIAAMIAHSIQGVVMPTPAALAAAAHNPEVVVAGQLPSDPSAQPDQFKALLPKGSALTGCVSATIDRLRAEGTLGALAATWVTPVAPRLR